MWTSPTVGEKPLDERDLLIEDLELRQQIRAAAILARDLLLRHIRLLLEQEQRVRARVSGGRDLAGEEGRGLPLGVRGPQLRELFFNLAETEFV